MDTTGEEPAHIVVAGAVVRGNELLLCHRHPERRWYPNVWDLPGGHVEEGETPAEALQRELREELSIEGVHVGGEPVRLVDRDTRLDLRIWAVESWSDPIVNLRPDEHDEIGWFSASDLPHLELADNRYLPLLTELLNGRTLPPGVTPPPVQPDPPVFLFDGACAFCRRWADWLQRRLPAHTRVAPYQRVDDLSAYGLTADELATASYWIGSDGERYRGARSFGRALRTGAFPWSALGIALGAPPIAAVASRLYSVVARNRHRLPAPHSPPTEPGSPEPVSR